jgi:peptide/nickel transport system permease protein
MAGFLFRRIIQSVLLVFIVLTVTFFLLHLAPGDPMARYYHPDIPPQTVELIKKRLGLDRSVMEQYVLWMGSFARGNFGFSLKYQKPVSELLGDAIPNTLRLTITALILHILLGVILGVISAIKYNSLFDRINTVAALFLYSIPSFWLGLMLILVFSLKLGILPSSHMQSLGYQNLRGMELFVNQVKHLILPAFVLGVASAASVARYMRGSMMDVLREDYINTARAKGLSDGKVYMKHAFRNAALPIVTIVGLSLPFLLGGSVIVEEIFSWPGMGRMMVGAIYARDYPMVLAINFVVSVLVIGGNLLADLGYAILDPRVTVASGGGGR